MTAYRILSLEESEARITSIRCHYCGHGAECVTPDAIDPQSFACDECCDHSVPGACKPLLQPRDILSLIARVKNAEEEADAAYRRGREDMRSRAVAAANARIRDDIGATANNELGKLARSLAADPGPLMGPGSSTEGHAA